MYLDVEQFSNKSRHLKMFIIKFVVNWRYNKIVGSRK